MKSVCVVGLGYIGLPTAVLAAQSGYHVFGYDIDFKKIDQINSGNSPFIEPEISERLAKVLGKNFFVSTDVQQADCFLIAVPTPFKQGIENKSADLSYVFEAAKTVSKVLLPGNLVILESTVSVGTTYEMAKFLEQETGFKLGVDLFVAHCPERVLPGKIFEELVKNDRVIGGVCEGSAHLAKTFYSKFVKSEFYLTDDKTAEMVKLVENSSRDVQIAFANQVDAMCKKAGISSFEVIECANKHPRVNILSPGCGVGGHCIAVDPWFLVETFPQESELLKSARNINDGKPVQIVADVLKKANELKACRSYDLFPRQRLGQAHSFSDSGTFSYELVEPYERKQDQKIYKPNLLILGLTFKPDVDDMRESPALKIALDLNKRHEDLELCICDPNVPQEKIKKLGFGKVCSLFDGVACADIILILVKHKEFLFLRDMNLKNKIVFDTCGLLYKSGRQYLSEHIYMSVQNIKGSGVSKNI